MTHNWYRWTNFHGRWSTKMEQPLWDIAEDSIHHSVKWTESRGRGTFCREGFNQRWHLQRCRRAHEFGLISKDAFANRNVWGLIVPSPSDSRKKKRIELMDNNSWKIWSVSRELISLNDSSEEFLNLQTYLEQFLPSLS